MIKQITLHNIESHTDTVLDFANQNAIIGSSSTGKSAVLRGLSSLLFFMPLNIRFANKDGSFKILTDGHTIERKRVDGIKWQCTACDTEYSKYVEKCTCGSINLRVKRAKELDIYSIDGCDYEKMGRGWKHLDQKIKDTWPLAYFEFTPDKPFFPGFKAQFDQFIWDQLSASELSYLFSFLEGLDYLEEMTKITRTDLSNNKKRVTFLKSDIEDMSEMLEDSEKLLKLREDEYKKKQAKFDEMAIVSKRYYAIERLFNSAYSNRKDIKRINEHLDTHKVVDLSLLAQHVFYYQNIEGVYKRLQSCVQRREYIANQLEEHDCSETLEQLDIQIEKHQKMQSMIFKAVQIEKEISVLDGILAEREKELEEINVGVKKRFLDNNICPFTGWTLAAECKRKMLDDK